MVSHGQLWPHSTHKKKSIKTPLIWPIIIYVCERLSEFNVPAKYQLVSAVNR